MIKFLIQSELKQIEYYTNINNTIIYIFIIYFKLFSLFKTKLNYKLTRKKNKISLNFKLIMSLTQFNNIINWKW